MLLRRSKAKLNQHGLYENCTSTSNDPGLQTKRRTPREAQANSLTRPALSQCRLQPRSHLRSHHQQRKTREGEEAKRSKKRRTSPIDSMRQRENRSRPIPRTGQDPLGRKGDRLANPVLVLRCWLQLHANILSSCKRGTGGGVRG